MRLGAAYDGRWARGIVALVALYALVAQMLLMAAMPTAAHASVANAVAVLCAHDPHQASPGGPAHGADKFHQSCCTAACPFAGAILPPQPGSRSLALVLPASIVLSWARESAPVGAAGPPSPFLARGPPA